jgi:hypothetical protein
MGRWVNLDTVPHWKITYTTNIRGRNELCETDMVLMRDLENIPTVDAVEVIRCEDCKHYYCSVQQGLPPEEIGLCDMDNRLVIPSDYCSKGERREDNA